MSNSHGEGGRGGKVGELREHGQHSLYSPSVLCAPVWLAAGGEGRWQRVFEKGGANGHGAALSRPSAAS